MAVKPENMELYLLHEDKKLSYREIGELKGMSPKTVKDRIRNVRYRLALSGEKPVFPVKELEPLRLIRPTLNSFMVISDLEVPDHDPKYLERVYAVSKALGVKAGVFAGDGLAFDQQGFTRWPNTFGGRHVSVKQAVKMFREIIDELLKIWDVMYFFPGNHDRRFVYANNGEVQLDTLIGMDTSKIVYTPLSQMIVDSSAGVIHLCHPSKFGGKNPLNLGKQLYNKTPEKGHWFIPHTHILQSGLSDDGLYTIHGIGAGRDPEKTDYLQADVSTYPTWAMSFGMVRNGATYNINIHNTDWSLFGCA